jgi:hypothetical protein
VEPSAAHGPLRQASSVSKFALPNSPISGLTTPSVNAVTTPANASADDDADREVDDVAAQDERLEVLEHESLLGQRWRKGDSGLA